MHKSLYHMMRDLKFQITDKKCTYLQLFMAAYIDKSRFLDNLINYKEHLADAEKEALQLVITDTVNNQVYEIIKNMILERQLKPGERIDPRIIAEKYNISLMPVRNALQQLTTQGLVVTLQRVGFFVKKFTSKELLEIFNARKMFELYCLEQYF